MLSLSISYVTYRTERRIQQFEIEREEQKRRQLYRQERRAQETEDYLKKQRVGGDKMDIKLVAGSSFLDCFLFFSWCTFLSVICLCYSGGTGIQQVVYSYSTGQKCQHCCRPFPAVLMSALLEVIAITPLLGCFQRACCSLLKVCKVLASLACFASSLALLQPASLSVQSVCQLSSSAVRTFSSLV